MKKELLNILKLNYVKMWRDIFEFDINDVPYLSRLRGVKQSGIAGYIHPEASQYDRYEHSLGVAELTYELMTKRSMVKYTEEEIKRSVFTALIHDIQHPAFSHVLDKLYGTTYQEQHRIKILEKMRIFFDKYDVIGMKPTYKFGTDICEQLETDGGNPLVTVLKSPWPHMNTDRLDYIIRDAKIEKYKRQIIDKLFVNDKGIIVCTDKNIGTLLFNASHKLAAIWKSEENSGEQLLFAKLLQYCINKKIISEQSMYEMSDIEILEIFKTAESNEVRECVTNLLENKYTFMDIEEQKDVYRDNAHLRLLDPLMSIDGKELFLTELDNEIKLKYIELQKKSNELYFVIKGNPRMSIFESH